MRKTFIHLALLSASLALTGQAAVQLLPAGKFAARDGRPGPGRSWTLTDEQGARIAADLTALSAKTRFLFDWDHQTLRAEANGQPAPAAGWATQFEWRPGEGLYATDVQWTAKAQAAIDAEEYGYLSPVITFDKAGAVTGVLMAAITNYPALVGMDPLQERLAADLSHTPTAQEQDTMILAALIALLGLPATATEADAVTAVTALKATTDKPPVPTALSVALGLQADADEAAALAAVGALKGGDAGTLAVIGTLQTQIAALTSQLNGNQVETLVAGAMQEGKLLPALKEWAIDFGRKDLAGLQGYLAKAPKLPIGGTQTQGNEPGTAGGTAALTAAEKEVLVQMGVSEADYIATFRKAA